MLRYILMCTVSESVITYYICKNDQEMETIIARLWSWLTSKWDCLPVTERDVSPGPGAYNTDRPPLKEKNAPHYSMSPRTSPRRVDFTPSPNMYALPSTIGPRVPDRKGGTQAAILGRTSYLDFSADLAKTPGPAKYGALPPSQTKKRAPAYSLGGRAKTPRDINKVPGPGQYSPENVNAHLEASPRYHIGVRHSQYIMPTLPLANVD